MKELRLGVIGTGSVVREIYQYLYFSSRYSDLLSVEAICDTDDAALRWFGDEYGIPPNRRFGDYRSMLAEIELDAVAVNTPDSMHREPTIHALESGLDVFLPKPFTHTVRDADAIMQAIGRSDGFVGVDFHKRSNPIIQETRKRYAAGKYGRLQTSVWYMIDRLLVADPNHEPRFFASADFAERNSPVTFLTSHTADTFMTVAHLKPERIRSVGYKQKLPSLSPIAVDGYDLVDTEVAFEGGCVAHFITGWALPNTAHSLTVQSARLVFTDGLLDLNLDSVGVSETTVEGIERPNVLFRGFREDGQVTGFGMDNPGEILRDIISHRSATMSAETYRARTSPLALGFYTTLVCECAHRSLAGGTSAGDGVIHGVDVGARAVLREELGGEVAARYYEPS